jgi:CMP-N-acetylneuraminic acid synthetase
MDKHLITICARGGSKGLPGKNIRVLNGKPLIAYTIEIAKKLSHELNIDIGLSTDSLEIKNVAEDYELREDYTRPKNLAQDTTGKIDTIHDLLLFYERKKNITYDYIWDLDVTSPLRDMRDLLNSFKILQEKPDAYNIFSVSPARKNPYFNMVEETGDGYVKLIMDQDEFRSRQKAPVVYDMNASIYIFRRKFFEDGYTMSNTPKTLHYLMPHICFDIDSEFDFNVVEYLLKNNMIQL